MQFLSVMPRRARTSLLLNGAFSEMSREGICSGTATDVMLFRTMSYCPPNWMIHNAMPRRRFSGRFETACQISRSSPKQQHQERKMWRGFFQQETGSE